MAIYVRVEYVRTLTDIPAGHSASEHLQVEGHMLPWLRYFNFAVSATDDDYYELRVAEFSTTKPDGYNENETVPGVADSIQRWFTLNPSDNPDDDPDNDPDDDPDDDPDGDPDPLPPDYYEHFTSIGGTIYDAYGHQVPQDGAWQALESVGNPLVEKIINLGVWERIEDRDGLKDSFSRAVDILHGTTDLEKALRQIHRGVSESLPAIFNGSLPDATKEAILKDNIWTAQVQAEAAYWEAVENLNPIVPASVGYEPDADGLAFYNASRSDQELVRNGFIGTVYSFTKLGSDEYDIQMGDGGSGTTGWFVVETDGKSVVVGSMYNDKIALAWEGGGRLFAGSGSDDLIGSGDADRIYGGSGKDRLQSYDGKDLLDGGSGADTMAGGSGSDAYYVQNKGDVVSEKKDEGTDEIRSSISFSLKANVENLRLMGTTDIDGTGNASANTIWGNAGANDIRGGKGADKLYAGDDNKHDTFIFAKGEIGHTASAHDTVYQFDRRSGAEKVFDRIDLHEIDADDGMSGNQAFRFVTNFVTAKGSQADGQVRIVDKGDYSLIEIDYDGDNYRDAIISVYSTGVLHKVDIWL